MKREIKYRENIKQSLRKVPSFFIRLYLLIVLPFYIFLPLFHEGTIFELFKEWWDAFTAKYVWKETNNE